MTDADAGNIQVFIVEDELLPLREIEYDIRSAARLVALAVWLGAALDDEPDDGLLDQEVIDALPVRRISYGSPLIIEVPWGIYYAVAGSTILLELMKRIGRLRVDKATAGELDARREATREDAETTRSDRRSREYQERLAVLREVAAGLRPELNEADARGLDHFVRQAMLRPELIEDSMDAIWRLSQKTVRIHSETLAAGDDDADDIHNA